MKCPNCGYPRIAYNVRRKRSREDRSAGKKSESRTDYTAKCKRCGWEGEIR